MTKPYWGKQAPTLKVKRLTATAVLPVKAHQSDAGFDICADMDITINAGETVAVPTGLSIAIPEGFYGRLKGRSGLTAKTSLRVQEGTIDASYRGEIKVTCEVSPGIYDGKRVYGHIINKGDKIAQLIIQPLPPVDMVEVTELDDTDRGDGGFGRRQDADGKMFFIEVKNEKGKLRPDQITFGNFLKAQPVLYGVARSVDDAIKIVGG